MFSHQWFENNFSYLANQPKRKKKKEKNAGSCCELLWRSQWSSILGGAVSRLLSRFERRCRRNENRLY